MKTTTCIVGLVENQGNVIISGDSAGVSGLYHRVRTDVKVFKKFSTNNVAFGFGYTTSFRMGQLIQYHLIIPSTSDSADLHEYMVMKFVPTLRDVLKVGGYTTIKEGTETGGTFLVGVQKRLFSIDEDFQVGEHSDGYDACGCGMEFALGSLHSTRTMTDGKARVEMAMEAAVHFSGGVLPPFTTVIV